MFWDSLVVIVGALTILKSHHLNLNTTFTNNNEFLYDLFVECTFKSCATALKIYLFVSILARIKYLVFINLLYFWY